MQRVGEGFIEGQAFSRSYDSAPQPSPVSKLSLFLSLPVCCRSREGGWGGAKSNEFEKIYKSFNTLCSKAIIQQGILTMPLRI